MWWFKRKPKKRDTLTVKIDASDVRHLIKTTLIDLDPELRIKLSEVKDINRRLNLPDHLRKPMREYEELLEGLIELGRVNN